MPEYEVVTDQGALAAALESLAAGHGPVAVDVERASGFRYSQRAYLVQLYRRDSGVVLLDPPAVGDLTGLQEVIGDLEWVLHAASQDLPSLRELGLNPGTLFDTELCARLLGHARVGLAAVVEDTLGISLAKEHSASDWSLRPLPQSWLEYAALDVLHLVDVRDALDRELHEQNKGRLATEEFHGVLTRVPKPPPEEPWRRLSGLHKVRGKRQLAVARELWQARDAYARAEDTAPGRLVPDRALIAAVLATPTSAQELARVKEFTGRASRSQLGRWWAAIEAGRLTEVLPAERVSTPDSMPPPRVWKDRNLAAHERFVAARPIIEEHAEALGMPTENLLTPEHLRRIAWSPPDPVSEETIGSALAGLGARPWQIEETSQRIAEAFVASAQVDPEASASAS